MDETHMIQSTSSKTPEADTVRKNAGQLFRDMVILAELQAQLFRSDARELGEGIRQPITLFAVGLLLLVAAIPLCLVAIALALVAAGLPPAVAYALIGGLSLVAAAVMVLWARQRLARSPAAFISSREEFVRNIAWVKSAVGDLAARPQHAQNDSTNPRFNSSEL
jgi:hypothetical protein